MSHTYDVLCRECLRYVDLGKICNMDESGRPVPWLFGGWRDQETGKRIEGAHLWTLVERFLIVHRNHPLQMVSESYLEKTDRDDVWQPFESATEVLAVEPVPAPDDHEDSAEVQRRDRARGRGSQE